MKGDKGDLTYQKKMKGDKGDLTYQKKMKGDLDLISKLPEHITHHIQSFLPTKDAARTCILSKAWKSICSSYPIEYFDHNLFALQLLQGQEEHAEPPQSDEIRERFMDFVDHHLFRLVHQQQNHLHVRKLALKVVLYDSKYFFRLDHWMQVVKHAHHIEELCLVVKNDRYILWDIAPPDFIQMIYYDFPCAIFAIKGLQVGCISGCTFNSQRSFAGFSSSLKQLYLSDAFFEDENVLNNLLCCCPGIEVLEFEHCRSSTFSTLNLSNFPKLSKVSVKDYHQENCPFITFEIKATILESFMCQMNTGLSLLMICKFLYPPGSCSSIRKLFLHGCFVHKRVLFKNLATTFPFLEEAYLRVYEATMLERFAVRDRFESIIAAPHHCLRSLIVVNSLTEMDEIIIDCPSLRDFSFQGKSLKKLSLSCPSLIQFEYYSLETIIPSLFVASLGILDFNCKIDTHDDLETSWFVELRRFVEHVGRDEIPMAFLFCSSMATFNLEEVDATQVSPEFSVSLNVQIGHDNMQGQAALVDGLLWSTHPTTLTVEGIQLSYDFIKHMCEKLSSKSQDPSCFDNCEELCSKHWWHHVKDFEVESSLEVENIKENLSDFVEQYQTTSSYKKSTFKFHWF